jgi:hypothetical protein
MPKSLPQKKIHLLIKIFPVFHQIHLKLKTQNFSKLSENLPLTKKIKIFNLVLITPKFQSLFAILLKFNYKKKFTLPYFPKQKKTSVK